MGKEIISATKKFQQRKTVYVWSSAAVIFAAGLLLLFIEQARVMSIVLFIIGIVLLASAGPVYKK